MIGQLQVWFQSTGTRDEFPVVLILLYSYHFFFFLVTFLSPAFFWAYFVPRWLSWRQHQRFSSQCTSTVYGSSGSNPGTVNTIFFFFCFCRPSPKTRENWTRRESARDTEGSTEPNETRKKKKNASYGKNRGGDGGLVNLGEHGLIDRPRKTDWGLHETWEKTQQYLVTMKKTPCCVKDCDCPRHWKSLHKSSCRCLLKKIMP